ncbi:FAD-dependent oxidoreductase [Noviherbaspirillum massiliense]|uniref:FAD-dependent oxidoreductase n=1 Tax=Noviherbaspirillum massiliense TaxID=1465823 RepID=UPI000311AB83|nr:GMC family oxidoreductase [Noviherbaspirillum massiliense]
MLIEGEALAPGSCIQARVCIVGSGMGAISVARVLVDAGIDILLLEAGPVTTSRRTAPAIEVEFTGQPFRLPVSRGLEVGGGTAFWHGICAELDDIDFQQRDWIPHSGWPISKEDMAPHYREAWEQLCGGDRSAHPEVDAGLARLPVAADKLQSKVYQFHSPPFRGKELLVNWCGQGKARCIASATALQLVADEAGTVRHLIAGSGGRTFTVKADVFIVAAGGLETPRLLLNSGAGEMAGLCRDSWWLGRNLMDHPAAYVSQVVFRKRVDGHLFSGFDIGGAVKALPGFVVQPGHQRTHRLANHTVFIRPGINGRKVPNLSLMSFLGVRGVRDLRASHLKDMLTDSYIRWRVFHQRFHFNWRTHYGDLFFMTEQLPNPDSRVDLSEHKRDRYGYPVARVNWQLGREDVDSFERSLHLIMDSLDRHPDVRSTRKDGIEDWVESASSAAHHLGTARMALSPADGVVDRNLKVFGVNNLWVCDGSVFPTAGSANPSLTICALGHRLGVHLLSGGTRLQDAPEAGRRFTTSVRPAPAEWSQ